jgi:hypothetical protein
MGFKDERKRKKSRKSKRAKNSERDGPPKKMKVHLRRLTKFDFARL